MEISNVLMDIQIEFNQYKESFEKWTKNNCITIAALRIEKKLIEPLLKEKDDNNCLLIIGNYKVHHLMKLKK